MELVAAGDIIFMVDTCVLRRHIHAPLELNYMCLHSTAIRVSELNVHSYYSYIQLGSWRWSLTLKQNINEVANIRVPTLSFIWHIVAYSLLNRYPRTSHASFENYPKQLNMNLYSYVWGCRNSDGSFTFLRLMNGFL